MELSNWNRRLVLKGLAASTAVGLASPLVVRHAQAQASDLSAYQSAKIDWRQAEGENITVAVIPAGYFENLITLAPQFQELTGINVRFEKVPPAQIRQKAVLDLTSGTGTYATHAADPMYYPLYQANGWVEDLTPYLDDASLTDKAWFRPEDIVPSWLAANSIEGKVYGIPYDGEVTLQVLRKDLHEAKGLKPADDFEGFLANAKELHAPQDRVWATALRGLAGAGQNVYIYSSIFRAFGGEWLPGGTLTVNGPEAEAALAWYVDTMKTYAPAAAQNWNWPDIADAFSQGTLASYIDAHSSASVINNPEKSQVIGKISYARWPKGPSGKRVSSIWNWGFPINTQLSDEQKKATWLFIQWAASPETQIRTSYKFEGATRRSGVNRLSMWEDPGYIETVSKFGDNFVEATLTALREDTDVEWRPRVPQWPGIGDVVATAVASALAGQATPKAALDAAQERVSSMMR
ncbi:ABC transporter substrate-binding protein [Tianweitania sediminis]|uniref:Sugar ABC transporter substrate-binding protein n=1 Tax=Tianweitania sediminis TaxID=1502156 RepID=A0A8J7UKV6_9HYPH|nr:sugar ABC transporter substrate-binding protein [Tianweitania sediminis]MBP0440084.1 sugar ABC transporter substrate-binding protein [Tianweitania sediminis]